MYVKLEHNLSQMLTKTRFNDIVATLRNGRATIIKL